MSCAPSRTCVSCSRNLPSREFRGNRYKALACQTCEAERPNERWCVDCAAWLPEDDFYKIGERQRFQTMRCKPCRVLNQHGVTRSFMAELTGSDVARCGACGADQRLSVDHDHNHCAGERGCPSCVRGYLCRSCNTAEGLLGTAQRARLLADYMERRSLTPEQLAILPPSTRPGPRSKTYKGAPRKWHDAPVSLT